MAAEGHAYDKSVTAANPSSLITDPESLILESLILCITDPMNPRILMLDSRTRRSEGPGFVDWDPRISDPMIRDSMIRDPRIRDSMIRDPRIRDPRIRDPRIRDSRIRDARIRDSGSVISDEGFS
jgi:hypothetical protein